MENLNRLLSCLEYPRSKEFDISSKQAIIHLVAWLEDRKIRHLEIAEREGLRRDDSAWDGHFASYLNQLESPFEWKESSRMDCLVWLVSHAISAEYEDCAEMCTNLEPSADPETEMVVDDNNDKGHADQEQQQITIEQLDSIGKLVGIQHIPEEPVPEFLSRVSRAIRMLIAADTAESSNIKATLGDFPLGFDTPDKKVNDVALVLKMLYLAEFREVQNDMNALIVLGQEYTANPKTNNALGKVGR